ncbi:adenylosuccinate lyase [Elsinoe australis]|uniref:Adenylosuccinate lyase n=1 Tax=Elsinoe australis TaxID=40998 RepID=A0A2P7YCA4_9PEZI|nr:adenylosuccinate lyase [Elsinoe australis]
MVYSLLYRRPSRVSLSQASISGDEKQKSLSDSVITGSSRSSAGIPDALSFDRIINGGTCPPCTVRDFMNYMKYIEHDAENLQFYLWFRNYSERFFQLPKHEQALSPLWSTQRTEADTTAIHTNNKQLPASVAEFFQGTDFDNAPKTDDYPHDSFSEPRGHSSDTKHTLSVNDSHTDLSNTHTFSARSTDDTYASAGLQWAPFTTNPFREEISRIIAIYIAPDSPRQLNLSSRERDAVLHALQNTTHPSAFHAATTSVEYTLRHQAHPNFIRWAICNGNRSRVVFARGLGVSVILLSLIASIVLALSSAPRAYRAIPLAGYLIGISTLIAAYKGMCVVLHGMHHRHVRPWELFGDENAAAGGLEEVQTSNEPAAEKKFFFSRGSLVSEERNSYEDEPWVARYEKRNLVRKVFDREVWIQEPALRGIQDTIFVQSLIGAAVVGGVLTGIFVAVPAGGFF